MAQYLNPMFDHCRMAQSSLLGEARLCAIVATATLYNSQKP